MNILTVNVGSSSVRLALYDRHRGQCIDTVHWQGHESSAAQRLHEFKAKHPSIQLAAIGHRIVHGGDAFTHATRVDQQVEAQIDKLGTLAPLHNPRALEWLHACLQVFGAAITQIAVFDTAFFAGLPEVARRYAIPQDLAQRHGLHRYGFHGLAHRAMWQQWSVLSEAASTEARVISLQLGSGCSMAAIHNGYPIDTSMGYSPLEGLVMATRPGDVDAGLVLALQQQAGLSIAQVEHLLNAESGLQGLSNVSNDIRVLLATTELQAQLAVDMYCYRVRKYIGAYLAALGGADAILIGGGVGENIPAVRVRILQHMQWAGITLDTTLNEAAVGIPARIDAADSRVAIHVLPVDEGQVLFDEVLQVLNTAS